MLNIEKYGKSLFVEGNVFKGIFKVGYYEDLLVY